MSRLVVVSNRVASVTEGSATAGGLAVAVLEALGETGGLWFGWSGNTPAQPRPEPKMVTRGRITTATVDLAKRDYDLYYRGFANGTLWPILHYRLDLTEFNRATYDGYLRVNGQFAHQLLPLLREDDLIWVHDYHLIPLAEELRRLGVKNRIGFFLHTPFPASELIVAMPNHARLMRALCAYDLVGFQTWKDLKAFSDYVIYEAQGEVSASGIVRAYGRILRAAAFPIGIHPDEMAALAEEAGKTVHPRRLAKSLGDRKLLIGVDRLDYSKGLLQRFHAVERLLQNYPDNRGGVTFMQIAPPSRSDVETYREIRNELEGATGHINGRYAEYDWVPIHYLNKSFNRKTLMGFFRLANLGVITPLRDGMNLVAKEYVASQDPENPGVLVLSRFAGAAQELDAALIVNPFDVEEVADALQRGLTMDKGERILRWQAMMDVLRRNDLRQWRRSFVEALAGPGR